MAARQALGVLEGSAMVRLCIEKGLSNAQSLNITLKLSDRPF